MRLSFFNHTKIAIGNFRTSLTKAQLSKHLSFSNIPRRKTKSVVAPLDPWYSYPQRCIDRHSLGNDPIIYLCPSSVLAESF
jgi:hypothetical protein